MFLLLNDSFLEKTYKGTTKNAHTQVKRAIFAKKMIDFIYLIDLLPFIGSLLVYGWR